MEGSVNSTRHGMAGQIDVWEKEVFRAPVKTLAKYGSRAVINIRILSLAA